MSPLEFFASNLNRRQKVKLIWRHPSSDNVKEVICFFKGYRNYCEKRVVDNADDIIPVFCECTKNGKMSNRELRDYIKLEDIANIEILGPFSNIPTPQVPNWNNAVNVINKVARQQILAILKDMDSLFPGMSVPLSKDGDPRLVLSVAESHGGVDIEYPGVVLSLSCKDGHIVYEIDQDVETFKGTSGVFVPNFAEVLDALVNSILDPPAGDEDDEIPGQDCIRLHDYTWETLPLADKDKQPTLFELGLLEQLRVNLWWESLSEKDKTDLMNGKFKQKVEDYYQANYLDKGTPDTSYAAKCDLYWGLFDADWKYYVFNCATNKI